jgi:Ca2+-transporting ATPase
MMGHNSVVTTSLACTNSPSPSPASHTTTTHTTELGWADYKKTRDAASVVQMIPFSSERKAMGVVVKLMNGRARLYLKGASEILSKKCTRHVIVSKDASQRGGHNEEVETTEIDELASDNISRTIIFYANQTLRTIALCYRDFESWPPHGAETSSEDEVRRRRD